jgi:DNA-binding GntR family transcriptional regulator
MLGLAPTRGTPDAAARTAAALAPYLETSDEERLPQRAYQALRHAIRELRFAPGQMVLEKDAAEALGISRTPAREALVRLESEGLLRLVPRHGFVVAPLDPAGLREIYEILEAFKRALGRANLRRETRFHGLRHMAATQLLANGVDIPAAAAVLGHSQNSTTLNVYAMLSHIRGATAAIQRAIRGSA